MQDKPPSNEDYSMDYFNSLIESIKTHTGLNEESIALRINYNKGYISQARSRGEVSAKFVQALKAHFAKSLQNAKTEVTESPQDYESRRTLERTLENLSEDKIRSTAIIERLVTMLERQFSSGVLSKASEVRPDLSTSAAIQTEHEDLDLGKKYKKIAGTHSRRGK